MAKPTKDNAAMQTCAMSGAALGVGLMLFANHATGVVPGGAIGGAIGGGLGALIGGGLGTLFFGQRE